MFLNKLMNIKLVTGEKEMHLKAIKKQVGETFEMLNDELLIINMLIVIHFT